MNHAQMDGFLSADKLELLALLLEEEGIDAPAPDSIPPRQSSENLPLSFAQQRLWFLEQLEPGSAFYNMPAALRMTGTLNLPALEQTLNALIQRHESLRTTFAVENDQPIQIIHPTLTIPISVIELNTTDEAEVRRHIKREAQQPFDLENGPLLRCTLLKLRETEQILLFTTHHIISDGWSLEVLVREVGALYESFCQGKSTPLPALPIQYADFALWQRQWLQGEVLETQLSYWKQQLAGEVVLELPADRTRPAVNSFQGERQSFTLSAGLTESLKALSRQAETTLFMTLLAAFKTLLYRYTGQSDLRIGTPVANRNRTEIEGLIGFFVNTLVLRTEVVGELSFLELLAQVRDVTLAAQDHQDIPFERLVEALQPERSINHTPLFQVMFALQNASQTPLALPGLTLTPLLIDSETAKFDLSLSVEEINDELVCEFEYSTDLFDAGTITRMLGHFQTLLEGIIANPQQCLYELPVLTASERHQLLFDFNQTHLEISPNLCIHQLFEAQVEKTPDHIAVVFENQSLTYRQLNEKANQLAHYLRSLEVKPEVVVGLCVERSLETIVGILGILKAGGAYVPLDPTYPQDRLAFMWQDSQISIVLTQQKLIEKLSEAQVQMVCLDSEWEVIAQHNAENLVSTVTAKNLAYVIYTSGSTGKPKGVLVCHNNVVRLFEATQSWFHFSERDVWTLFHSYAFDFSVWELWGALFYGGRCVVVPYWVSRSPDAFYDLLCKEQVTVLNQTPSAFRQLMQVEESEKITKENHLRLVIFGGEALQLESLKPWFERHGDERPQLVNMYGITETTVHVTYRPITLADVHAAKGSVIGVPIQDLQVYVLDQYQQLVPIGVPGEMYIGGAGVSSGYLNRPDLTNERFIPNPFAEARVPGYRGAGEIEKSSSVLYKSGDLARYLANGDLEYLGRIDHQVKIRGFRIELGEIESVLAQHPAVLEQVVFPCDDHLQDQRLVAYVVPNAEQAFTVRQLLRLEKEGLLTNRSKYELPNGMVIVHSNKSETDFIYKEIFEDSQYLRHDITLNEDDCIFDIGANIGLFSIFVGQVCKDAKIFAFEPIPPIFELLHLNATLHGLNIKLFDCGISSESKQEIFTYYPQNSVVSGRFANAMEERETIKNFLLNKQQQGDVRETGVLSTEEIDELTAELFTSQHFTCRLKTISEVICEEGIEQIDLLKIDVEKSELDVLGSIQEEDWSKIRQIVVEVHDINGQLNSVIELLNRHGYELAIDQEELLKNTRLYNVYGKRCSSSKDNFIKTTSQHSIALKQTWSSPNRLVSDLRSFLSQKLPDYMLPSSFVLLDTLPLTANGKIDRCALPAPNASRPELEETFVAPRTPTERQIAEIWTQLLHLQNIGIHDNFFELGGHSLLATQIMSRLHKTFQVKVPLRSFFESPTIAQLATQIEAQLRVENLLAIPAIQPRSQNTNIPLSFAQQRLWFIQQLDPESSAYNVPAAVRLKGTLNVPALQKSLDELVQRHEVFRTTFGVSNGQPFQVIHPTGNIQLSQQDLTHLSHPESYLQTLILEVASQPFDLTQLPLWNITLFKFSDNDFVLLLTLHHIIADGWSMEVLVSEIAALYEAFCTGNSSPLPPLSIQYADFAIWQRQWLQGDVLETQLSDLQQQLGDQLPELKLPTNKPRPAVPTYQGAREYLQLSSTLSEQIKALSSGAGVTLFMTLVAAFNTLLYWYTNQDDIVIGTDVANRNQTETEGLIGFFVNQLVLRVDLSGNPTFQDLLVRVRDVTLKAYAHQDVPFKKLVEVLNPARKLSKNPLFDVKLVLQNTPSKPLELSHLTLEPMEVNRGTATFDLLLNLSETETGITGTCEYSTDLYDAGTIKQMLEQFKILLTKIVEQPNLHLNDLKTHLTTSEKALQMAQQESYQQAIQNKLSRLKRR